MAAGPTGLHKQRPSLGLSTGSMLACRILPAASPKPFHPRGWKLVCLVARRISARRRTELEEVGGHALLQDRPVDHGGGWDQRKAAPFVERLSEGDRGGC